MAALCNQPRPVVVSDTGGTTQRAAPYHLSTLTRASLVATAW